MLLNCCTKGGCGAACTVLEHPVNICDDAGEHREGANVTCAVKRCEHIFSKTIAVCLAVVCVEENVHVLRLPQ
jgi:hypothetical protein